MQIPIYQIDTFTDKIFKGNPAAVCPLQEWLPDTVLQSIAAENNLSETAFFVKHGDGYQLRWFTPLAEVDLCGHATLASAYVLFYCMEYEKEQICFYTRICFHTKSGDLFVRKTEQGLQMDLPLIAAKECKAPDALLDAIQFEPQQVLVGQYYIVVLQSQKQVEAITPDLAKLRSLDRMAVAVTALGDSVDFVCRFFAPKIGIDEDPVTGSMYCEVAPYWSHRLDKTQLSAQQLSMRGGEIACEVTADRVLLTGQAVMYFQGIIIHS